MNETKVERIQLSEISEYINTDHIKNFIISDKALSYPDLSIHYPFVLDGIAFGICTKGYGKVKINFKEYVISPNSISTILPYHIVDFTEMSEEIEINFLIFSVDFVTEMTASSTNTILDVSPRILQSPILQITNQEMDIVLDFYSFILKQYNRTNHLFREYMSKHLLFALFAEIGALYISRESTKVKQRHTDEIVSKFLNLLAKYYKEQRSVTFYADKMCLSPKHLSTTIKKSTGRTMHQWINEAVIVSSKFLLKSTNQRVAEISDSLNFPNPSFFSKLFRQHVGMTPLEYRNS